MGCSSSLPVGTVVRSDLKGDRGEEQMREAVLEDLPLSQKHHRTTEEIKEIKSPCKVGEVFQIYCLERGKTCIVWFDSCQDHLGSEHAAPNHHALRIASAYGFARCSGNFGDRLLP